MSYLNCSLCLRSTQALVQQSGSFPFQLTIHCLLYRTLLLMPAHLDLGWELPSSQAGSNCVQVALGDATGTGTARSTPAMGMAATNAEELQQIFAANPAERCLVVWPDAVKGWKANMSSFPGGTLLSVYQAHR